MTFKEIEKKAFTLKGKTINPVNKTELNKNIIEILKMCVDNNIKLELSENDFIKILNIYYELYNKYYDGFLKKVAEQSNNQINFMKVINNLTK